jgi:hypothetical protein
MHFSHKNHRNVVTAGMKTALKKVKIKVKHISYASALSSMVLEIMK